MLKSHQLVYASLLFALIGKVEFLDFLDQLISSVSPLLAELAPSPFLTSWLSAGKWNKPLPVVATKLKKLFFGPIY